MSTYAGSDGKRWTRTFAFGPPRGTYDLVHETSSLEAPVSTSVRLEGFKKWYSDRAPRSAQKIATNLLEHCLWYFVRPRRSPADLHH